MSKPMPQLQIDDKWSVRYDPKNNDKPEYWYRHGSVHSPFEENNAVLAMFYALLAHEQHNLEGR